MKKYELSITRNYVSSWGMEEAIRELIQNAYDQGNEDIDFGNGYISITNKNTSISSSTLALGTSTKRDDIDKVGCYGEGFKLALLVLLREGYNVSIYNGNKIWTPTFEHSDLFETEVLCIEETDGYGSDLTFEINGIPQYVIDELKDEFVGISGESYNSIPTMYGEILTDDKYKGKMFVNGLPIMQDDKFNFGYNFKPEYVRLDRDRKSINLRELYEITSLAVVYMENPDFEMVDNLIDSTSDDAHYLRNRNIDLPQDYVENYAQHLRERFGVDDKTIVVNCENKTVIEELKKKQKIDESIKFVETPRAIYADILNRTSSYSSTYLNDLHNEISHRSEIEKAWDNYECSDYKNFKEWFDVNKDSLSSQAQNDFKDILSNIEPNDFYLIEDEVWG